MNEVEKKEWLEWFLSVKNEASAHQSENSGLLYYFYINFADAFAYSHTDGVVHLNGRLQLILQEEIAKQGWFFHLRNYHKPTVLIKRFINNGKDFECMAERSASTIPEAFMLAFKAAWKVQNDNG